MKKMADAKGNPIEVGKIYSHSRMGVARFEEYLPNGNAKFTIWAKSNINWPGARGDRKESFIVPKNVFHKFGGNLTIKEDTNILKLKKLIREYINEAFSIKDIENKLNSAGVYPDKISKKSGIFTVRKGFFYTHGYTAKKYRDAVKKALPDAQIIDYSEVWKAFKGGASIERQSHWFVKFKI